MTRVAVKSFPMYVFLTYYRAYIENKVMLLISVQESGSKNQNNKSAAVCFVGNNSVHPNLIYLSTYCLQEAKKAQVKNGNLHDKEFLTCKVEKN